MTVRIKAVNDDPELQKYVDAAEHAVRYAGTEFVPLDESRNQETPDVDWTIALVHEGALVITSKIHKLEEVPEQTFRISFSDVNDLPRRIESRVHSELNRIRYIWPYRDTPTVLRDVNFSLEDGSGVIVEKVTWKSIRKGEFDSDKKVYDIFKVDHSDMSTFTLSSTRGKQLTLDPMSNIAYRVVLSPPRETPRLFRYLTLGVVLLFAAALLAGLIDIMLALRARAQSARAEMGVPPPGAVAAIE
jgi:hypothetical protein